jgi:hypothetical protein
MVLGVAAAFGKTSVKSGLEIAARQAEAVFTFDTVAINSDYNSVEITGESCGV